MLKKLLLSGLFFSLIAAFPPGATLEAANVSFLVIETGQAVQYGSQYPILWENSLLEVFFENGHIVSNFPIIRLPEKPGEDLPDIAEKDYHGAQDGGMDYFIVTIVDYSQANVSLRLFNTQSPRMINEQTYTVNTFRNTKEENEKIKTAVGIMAANLR